MAGTIVGALVVTGFVAPAIGASDVNARLVPVESLSATRSITSFTPASADPRLAALIARSGLEGGDYRFTPSESRRTVSRAVTVAVRARSSLVIGPQHGAEPEIQGASVGLAPIAYNLGVSVGWKRFALSGDVTRVELANAPGSREAFDLGLSYAGKRVTGRVTATADRPLPIGPKLVSEDPSYAVDVGGSYRLTRNVDLTAGLRYKTENNRLERLADNRRDSQAVYIGTALRF
ncbi:MAG: hypothetical protein B7Y43_00505 [Sphingomonas sp. 28-62-20]|nr:MAG: hypothetical protein B7Y43_00505 [Sphingomonas sp. 28-62-20]